MKKTILLLMVLLLLSSCGNTTKTTTTTTPKPKKTTQVSGCYIYKSDIQVMPGYSENEESYGKDSYSADFLCFQDNGFVGGQFDYFLDDDYMMEWYSLFQKLYDQEYDAYVASGKNIDNFVFDVKAASKQINKQLNENDYSYRIQQHELSYGQYVVENDVIKMISKNTYDDSDKSLTYTEGNFFIGKNDIAFERLRQLNRSNLTNFVEFSGIEYTEQLEERTYDPFVLSDYEDFDIELYNPKTDKTTSIPFDFNIEKKLKSVDSDTSDLQIYLSNDYAETLEEQYTIASSLNEIINEMEDEIMVFYAWKDYVRINLFNNDIYTTFVVDDHGTYIEYTDYSSNQNTLCHVDFKTGTPRKKAYRPLEDYEQYSCDELVDTLKEDTTYIKKALKKADVTIEQLESFVETK